MKENTFEEIVEKEYENMQSDASIYSFIWFFLSACYITALVKNLEFNMLSLGQGVGYGLLALVSLMFTWTLIVEMGPFFYKLTDYSRKIHNSKEDKQFISKKITEVFSTMIPITYFFFLVQSVDYKLTFTLFLMSVSIFSFIPLILKMIAKKINNHIESNHKKPVIKRVSSDGEVDLTNLPYLFTNLNDFKIQNSSIQSKLKDIQETIDYVSLNTKYLDIEDNYIVKRIGTEEVFELIDNYADLDHENQILHESSMTRNLNLIFDKLFEMKKLIDAKKSSKIQKSFDIIQERYSKDS